MKKLVQVLLIGIFIMFSQAMAQYPSKTIKIIVPSKAGGSTDTTARLFAQVAKKYWKNADFLIVNKPGAGGLIGFEAIKRAKADGYTLGLVFTPQLVAHIVAKRARYTLDDFKIIGNVVEDPGIVAVPKDSKINSLEDLVKAAKTKKITVAVNGIGSDDFLAVKNFEKITGVKFNLMPTKGSTEQKAAILGNHIDASFMNLSQMLTQYKAGKAKIIAVLDKERSKVAPKVPTSVEQNFNVTMTATRGFIIRKNVKNNIYNKISDLFNKVISDPDFVSRAEKSYIFLKPSNSKEYRTYLENLQETTQKVYNITPW